MKFLEREETKPRIAKIEKLGESLRVIVTNNKPHNITLLNVYAQKLCLWPWKKKIDLNWNPPRNFMPTSSGSVKELVSVCGGHPNFVIKEQSLISVDLPDELEKTTYKICVETSAGVCEALYRHLPPD